MKMKQATEVATLLSILAAGALFGFFYTLSISVMPGLDLAEPYSAIVVNQAMGRATQNMFFTAALLGTPLLLIIAFVFSSIGTKQRGRFWFIAAFTAFIGMVLVTMLLNVPLNQTLDALAVAPGQGNLQQLWNDYSIDWQQWNWLRVLFSGMTLLFASLGLLKNVTT